VTRGPAGFKAAVCPPELKRNSRRASPDWCGVRVAPRTGDYRLGAIGDEPWRASDSASCPHKRTWSRTGGLVSPRGLVVVLDAVVAAVPIPVPFKPRSERVRVLVGGDVEPFAELVERLECLVWLVGHHVSVETW
jgi:hypothetical protein